MENRVYRETTLIAFSFIIPLNTLVFTWQYQVMCSLHNLKNECSFNVCLHQTLPVHRTQIRT